MARIVRARNPLRVIDIPRSRDKWDLAYEAHLAQFGSREAARDYADHVAGTRNPFGASLVEGIGTGTGLAIAAGVAGPFIVRRVRGALQKVGVKNPDTSLADIKAAVRRATRAGRSTVPYVMFMLRGKEALIPTHKYDPHWWSQATMEDVERVAVT